ncbi:MAG: hypothetical protein ACFFG0_40790 [Candidatus Thorarchaeota archaeon]
MNNNIHEVGYKVELVDKLYNCHLRQDIRNVANAILSFDIDSEFEKSGSFTVVNKIAEIKLPQYKKKEDYKRLGEVFASKYCHFHYPHKFPIIDSFSKIALSKLLDKKVNIFDNNYTQFVHDINALKKIIGFEITYAQLDTYLWLYGQWLDYKNRDKCSHEFRYLVEYEYESLKDLSPGN